MQINHSFFRKNDIHGFKNLLILGLIIFCTCLIKILFIISIPKHLFFEYSALLILFPLFFIKYKYKKDQRAINILLIGISLMLGFYGLLNYQGYLIEEPDLKIKYDIVRYSVFLYSILSIIRPAFVLVPLVYTVWRKKIDVEFTGIYISPTDYMPVVEVGLLLLTGYMIVCILEAKKFRTAKHRDELFLWVLVASVGIHFGNYFYSGVGKINLDGGPLSWVLENKTHYLMMTSIETGLLPIAIFTNLVQFIFDLFESAYILFNAVTLFIQIACIIFIISPKKIIYITICYDLMHLLIFILTGIFFWKWIILNLLVISSMMALGKDIFQWRTKLIGIIFLIGGINIFFTAQLAWYDTRALKHTYIKAVTNDLNNYNIPSNYFLNASLTFAQGRLLPNWHGHFYNANALGSTNSYQVMKNHNDCDPILINEQGTLDYTLLSTYVSKYHQYISQNIAQDGLYNYDLFPHHVWSNPFLYDSFYRLNKDNINHYLIIVESKCLELRNGKINKELINKSVSEPIYAIETGL